MFWFFLIDKDLNYDHLAKGLKEALLNDNSAFDADRLQKYTGNSYSSWASDFLVSLKKSLLSKHSNIHAQALSLMYLLTSSHINKYFR